MKRITLLAAGLCLVTAGNAQTAATRTASKWISLNIAPFIAVNLDGSSLDLRADPIAGQVSSAISYHVTTNVPFHVYLSGITKPSGAPTKAVFSAMVDSVTGPAGPNTLGSLTLSVKGLDLNAPAKTYSNGSITLTISQA